MDHSLVILCGGNSTRMGSDKALLPFGDYCLIEYLVKKFQPHFSKIYLSVKKKGDYAHLNLPVTEISDIYPNAGPMSGIFSGLSMIDENSAFFMSVDTPFLEPETGIALLEAIGSADICTIRGKASYLETATAAYSKNCTTSIGKCLLLHQLTFTHLRESCRTKYLTEKAIAEHISTPIDVQFYNLDTRPDYYHALRILSGLSLPDSENALVEYFHDTKDLFLQTTPTLSFVSRPGTLPSPYIQRLLPLLEREGLKVVFLSREDTSIVVHNVLHQLSPESILTAFHGADLIITENFGTNSPNKIEVLRKGWSEEISYPADSLLAVVTDFPLKTTSSLPIYDINHPKSLITFILGFLSQPLAYKKTFSAGDNDDL